MKIGLIFTWDKSGRKWFPHPPTSDVVRARRAVKTMVRLGMRVRYTEAVVVMDGDQISIGQSAGHSPTEYFPIDDRRVR